MVKHIVLFKLKPDYKSRQEEYVQMLLDMKSKINEIIEIEAGVDFIQSDRSYDIGLIVSLADRSALQVYADHPDHQPVKEALGEAKESVVAVDVEF